MTDSQQPRTLAELEAEHPTIDALEAASANAELAEPVRFADVNLTFDEADCPPDQLPRRSAADRS